jgi:DNA polymerase III subunit epsilon
MRQIVLDTETTGLELTQGHRIIEIGCVELMNRRHTGRHFHHYLNPGRDIDAGAVAVHGLLRERLESAPRFADIVQALIEFIGGSELIIHNAAFDLAFLDMELTLLPNVQGGALPSSVRAVCSVLDTLTLARERHPGQRNNLDALCKRYGIDSSHRELHGALLDARLLADVYLAMTGGQSVLAFEELSAARDGAPGLLPSLLETVPPLSVQLPQPLRIIEPSALELAAHAEFMALLQQASRGRCIWMRAEAERASTPEKLETLTMPPALVVDPGAAQMLAAGAA